MKTDESTSSPDQATLNSSPIVETMYKHKKNCHSFEDDPELK